MSSEPSFDTVLLHDCVDRMRAGDRAAADRLLRGVGGRFERLAHQMLRGFPNVRRWADTGDVLQSALVRLLRTLEAIRPTDTRAFVNLAAVHIRRELLDLARHYRARPDRHAVPVSPTDSAAPAAEVPAPQEGADDLELWAAFHEAVERLPAEEREVVGLTFYHGWTQPQIAELFGVDERTIRRRWRAASLKLTEALGGRLPQA
jgi:RNA polymerase sigma-70 factor (ECF subfamily)